MFRYLLFIIILLHGLIHFMGFGKAFGYTHAPQLTAHISRLAGTAWFIAAILFIAAAIILLIKKDMWWMTALLAIIISQLLIVSCWQDAKFGTIVNILLLLVIIAVYGNKHFEQVFKKDVAASLQSSKVEHRLLTEADITQLPPSIQQYIRYSGAINRPLIKNMRIVFDGEMRAKGKDWFPFSSEQYNFFDEPTRLFFMKATMFGIKVPGYHAYKNAAATMQVKLFGWIPVVDKKGAEMNKAETVTLFNDMCIFAPAALIDKRIQWAVIDDSTVKAVFTNHDISITALLYFNDAGQLVNFVSDDRYDINAKNQYRFSTPVRGYKNINGFHLAAYGETVWHYPEAQFTYGKFYLRSIEYNLKHN